MSNKITLNYWPVRGLAQSLRAMLEYAEVDWEDHVYPIGANYDTSSWFDVKFKLDLPFPNLPWLQDGERKISQSGSIHRYLARKFNLYGNTEDERIAADVVADFLREILEEFGRLAYDKDFESLKGSFIDGLPKKFEQLSDFLGNKTWFAGANLTYADFMAYDILLDHSCLAKEKLEQFPKLTKFMKNFENVPQIKDFVKSERYLKYPLFTEMALYNA